jgi:hypothetical protein
MKSALLFGAACAAFCNEAEAFAAVSETATWALMLALLGLLGTTLRGRRQQEIGIG